VDIDMAGGDQDDQEEMTGHGGPDRARPQPPHPRPRWHCTAAGGEGELTQLTAELETPCFHLLLGSACSHTSTASHLNSWNQLKYLTWQLCNSLSVCLISP
jgi:hypothetical protein